MWAAERFSDSADSDWSSVRKDCSGRILPVVLGWAAAEPFARDSPANVTPAPPFTRYRSVARPRGFYSVFTVLLLAAALADPPGQIVIRPSGSPPEPAAAPAKEKPGFLVIRPNGTPPSGPSQPRLETQPQKPVMASGATPIPVQTPVPVGDPKTETAKPTESDALGKIISESWDALYIKGQKAGYFHVVVRETEKNGTKYVYATKEQKLTVARFGEIVDQWAEDATLENTAGEVLVVQMKQGIARNQQLAITGEVQGNLLKIKGEGPAATASDIAWPEGVYGIAREANIYKDRKPKPGDSFEYKIYEPRLNSIVTMTVTCKALETVALVEGQPAKPLLKFDAGMQPLKDGKGSFQLPSSTVWVDPTSFEIVRQDADVPSMGGKTITLRTTKEIALRPPGKVPDLFEVQSIKLDRDIPGIHEQKSVVYRITAETDKNLFDKFPRDGRQDAVADGAAVELTVTALRSPKPGKADPEPDAEYLSKSFFVDWAAGKVKQHAAAAVADLPPTATEWEKAKAVEHWVHSNIKAVEFSQAMAPAAEVSKTLSGDCTEYAMLACGMCRALGIPSKTALGLVYATGRDGKPYLAYHMWFEVYAGGQWLALDGTLGRGSVGPGHIKITDTSWDKVQSLKPLLPVLGVLTAQPKVSVTKVER